MIIEIVCTHCKKPVYFIPVDKEDCVKYQCGNLQVEMKPHVCQSVLISEGVMG